MENATTEQKNYLLEDSKASPPLAYRKIHSNARAPSRGRAGDAGFDVYACFRSNPVENLNLQKDGRLVRHWSNKMKSYKGKEITIPPGCRAIIPLGLAVYCRPDTAYKVTPRSGLACKYGIDVLGGLIDSNYRGELLVILQNHGEHAFSVQEGSKVAQLLPIKIHQDPEQGELPLLQELPDSERGEAGFGSSGM